MHGTLTGIFVYPVKAARGIALSEGTITSRGLADDRRFMVVDEHGRFVTQREEGQLARLVPAFVDADTLSLTIDGVGSVRIPRSPGQGARRAVDVWGDQVNGLDLGSELATFLGDAFGRPLSLVYMPDDARRSVQPAYAEPDDIVSFADAFPYLLCSEASLAELNGRLQDAAVPMARFRPNLVVRCLDAFAEDSWDRIRIGDVEFAVRKPCTRCVVVTRDQLSGESRGAEPLRTLARYRTWQKKAIFGQNLLSRSEGGVALGDSLSVLSTRTSPH